MEKQIPNKQEFPYGFQRGLVWEKIFNLEKQLGQNNEYFSQSGQDKILNNFIFKSKKSGFFVEIRAFCSL